MAVDGGLLVVDGGLLVVTGGLLVVTGGFFGKADATFFAFSFGG